MEDRIVDVRICWTLNANAADIDLKIQMTDRELNKLITWWAYTNDQFVALNHIMTNDGPPCPLLLDRQYILAILGEYHSKETTP